MQTNQKKKYSRILLSNFPPNNNVIRYVFKVVGVNDTFDIQC